MLDRGFRRSGTIGHRSTVCVGNRAHRSTAQPGHIPDNGSSPMYGLPKYGTEQHWTPFIGGTGRRSKYQCYKETVSGGSRLAWGNGRSNVLCVTCTGLRSLPGLSGPAWPVSGSRACYAGDGASSATFALPPRLHPRSFSQILSRVALDVCRVRYRGTDLRLDSDRGKSRELRECLLS